ncbi:MAG: hypothetical protein M3P44_00725, partial [Actinomycetota bacterium]|nr:hypothetical protein [Actinomycetota bacterium]
VVARPALFSARSARALIRRALRARLPRWTITALTCRITSPDHAACRFAAKRAGVVLRGSGTAVRGASGGPSHYRLTALISRTACHPRASRRCTRKAVWSP